MLYDLTQPLTQQSAADVQKQEPKALVGHLGTHFDCMGKPFPLAYTQLPCVLFDVTKLDKDTELPLRISTRRGCLRAAQRCFTAAMQTALLTARRSICTGTRS